MRIVLIGISHWHTPFYSNPVDHLDFVSHVPSVF